MADFKIELAALRHNIERRAARNQPHLHGTVRRVEARILSERQLFPSTPKRVISFAAYSMAFTPSGA
jgi:hypothetical protein